MSVNPNIFLHETDRAALEALQAIPGFSQVMKQFMSSWSEKLMYIENMSTHVRISENQLPRYHQMLTEISAKLGIEKPDLFLKLDVVPNAYTSGDTKPFIVITSGLLETMPEELIPTVLAHECGHIVCHHVLYRTMGTWILSGALSLVPLGALAIYPIMNAFHRWMRCSELSADRAAVLCDGSADRVIEMCMRFAGFDRNIPYEMNVDAFIAQAEEYKKLIEDKKLNRTLEHMRFSQATHPINAIRALEARSWAASENHVRARAYFNAFMNGTEPEEVPLSFHSRSFIGKTLKETEDRLQQLGFSQIRKVPSSEKPLFGKENQVISVSVNGSSQYEEGSWIARDSVIEIQFYKAVNEKNEDRQTAVVKHSHAWYFGRPYEDAAAEFKEAGFENIILEPLRDLESPDDKNFGKIITVTIGGEQMFRQGYVFSTKEEVRITHHDVLDH